MRKKIIKKPNPIGYAMLEKHGESNYVCLYDETAFDVVFEHAQEYIQKHSTQDYLDYDWQIVAYSNEDAWKEDGLYDSIVLRIKGNTIKQYDVVTEYLNAFHTRERDGVLLSTLESQITQICEKYCATPTWNTILEIDTLKNMYRSIKTNDISSYQEIYMNIDTNAKQAYS